METSIASLYRDSFHQVMVEFGLSGLRVEESSTGIESAILSQVGLTGALQGHFVFTFSKPSITGIANFVLERFSMRQQANDPAFLRETAAELANQLSARAVMGLSQLGLDCLITPPLVISGSSVFSRLEGAETDILFNLNSDQGCFQARVLTKKR